MAEMLVDSTKLDACLDAEADAIRAKTGDSSDIPFDFANNKGFADAIAAIPSAGSTFTVTTTSYTSVNANKVITHNSGLRVGTDSFVMIVHPDSATEQAINSPDNTSSTFYFIGAVIISKFFDYDMMFIGKNTSIDYQNRIYGYKTRGVTGTASGPDWANILVEDGVSITYGSGLDAVMWPGGTYNITIIQGQVS